MEFFFSIRNAIENKLDQATAEEIVKIAIVFRDVQMDKILFYEKLERQLIPQMHSLSFEWLCYTAEAFGFDLGSDELFNILNSKVLGYLN